MTRFNYHESPTNTGDPGPSDPRGIHFCHALADAYAEAAAGAGHAVKRVEIARLDFPLLRSAADWDAPLPLSLIEARASIQWSEHLVLVFPLWLGTMPALLKAFLEQVLRPGYGFSSTAGPGAKPRKGLAGKSARIVVTLGMPAFLYRWFFFAHGVKSLARSILKFCGVKPVCETYIGMVEAGEKIRRRALARRRELGNAGR